MHNLDQVIRQRRQSGLPTHPDPAAAATTTTATINNIIQNNGNDIITDMTTNTLLTLK